MEAVTSTGAEQAAIKELPETTVKEEPSNDIKDYAETTMNELLGLYGYEKVSIEEREELNLGQYEDGRQSRCSSQGDTPPWSDHENDTDDINSICSNPNETTLAAQHKNLVSALKSCQDGPNDSESKSETVVCSWCQNTGSNLMTFKTDNGTKVFCSETCFTQCRRATFKKNKVCDWCKHVRHTVNYVDFLDGVIQLQFCSEKCLNQYKMNLFCKETEEHLKQIKPQERCSSSGPEDTDMNSADEKTPNSQTLITPALWLHKQRRNKKSECNGSRRKEESRSRMNHTEPKCSSSGRSRNGSGNKSTSEENDKFYSKMDLLRKTRQANKGDNSADSNSTSANATIGKETPRRVEMGSFPRTPYPGWLPFPMMDPGQARPGLSADCQPNPFMFGPMASQRNLRRSADVQPTSKYMSSPNDNCFLPIPPDLSPRVPFPVAWPPGMNPSRSLSGGNMSSQEEMGEHTPAQGFHPYPPVTVLVPFPVVLPVPVPIPFPIPCTKEEIKTFFDKRKVSHSQPSMSEKMEANGPSHVDSHGNRQSKDRLFSNSMKCSKNESRTCSRPTTPVSPSQRDIVNCSKKEANSPSGSANSLDKPVQAELLVCPVFNNDVAIDLSTDKTGPKHASISKESSIVPTSENFKSSVPKIHIVDVKNEPPLSQVLPLPKTDHHYNKRRGRILDAPSLPKRPCSPNLKRRVYVRSASQGICDRPAENRCVQTKMKSKNVIF